MEPCRTRWLPNRHSSYEFIGRFPLTSGHDRNIMWAPTILAENA
jgi:hypothetical protein